MSEGTLPAQIEFVLNFGKVTPAYRIKECVRLVKNSLKKEIRREIKTNNRKRALLVYGLLFPVLVAASIIFLNKQYIDPAISVVVVLGGTVMAICSLLGFLVTWLDFDFMSETEPEISEEQLTRHISTERARNSLFSKSQDILYQIGLFNQHQERCSTLKEAARRVEVLDGEALTRYSKPLNAVREQLLQLTEELDLQIRLKQTELDTTTTDFILDIKEQERSAQETIADSFAGLARDHEIDEIRQSLQSQNEYLAP